MIGHERLAVRAVPGLAVLLHLGEEPLRDPAVLPDLAELALRVPGDARGVSYVLFIYVGIKKHGVGKYIKNSLVPPAPWYILPLLMPIEFISTFLIRPFSLAVRLFANMFAGHMLLLVFTLGGFALINANGLLAPISVLSWVLTIALTFLEFLVIRCRPTSSRC